MIATYFKKYYKVCRTNKGCEPVKLTKNPSKHFTHKSSTKLAKDMWCGPDCLGMDVHNKEEYINEVSATGERTCIVL
jgi:hypothetical protein